jgi:hypothetical protein
MRVGRQRTKVLPIDRSRESRWLLGRFPDIPSLRAGCEQLAERNPGRLDAHAPFALSGLERPLGLASSPVPWLTLASGILGGTAAFALQYWMDGVDYPLLMGGKGAFAWQAFIPVTFEVTVLFAAIGCFVSVWVLNGLPATEHPLLSSTAFRRASDDGFFLSVETGEAQPAFAMLEQAGALDVVEVGA